MLTMTCRLVLPLLIQIKVDFFRKFKEFTGKIKPLILLVFRLKTFKAFR